ncbi:type III PLP-dependent enzyme [Candidatus Calescamantes bacterium]|nr:type III PLP-dependent enzyme [Candidatus Calescamantes bacterium]
MPKSIDFNFIEEVAKRYDTPLFLISASKIRKNIQTLKNLLPNVEFFYAVKANPHPDVIKVVAENDVGFEVSSQNEFNLVYSLLKDSSKIIVSHPVKKEEEIEFYAKQGIRLFTVDSKEEIKKVKKVCERADILVRIQVKNSRCVVNLSSKFGIPLEEALDYCRYIKKLGLNPKGLAFHVGSQSLSPKPFINVLNRVSKFYEIAKKDGIFLEILNIGGGFPIPYKNPVPHLEVFCKPIKEILDKKFTKVKIMAEPGRAIVGDAGLLICKVIGITKRNRKIWYYVDESVYGLFSGKIYDQASYPLMVKCNGVRKYRSVIAGRTCDSFDIIEKEIKLPLLKMGDLIVALQMGAYTYSSSSEFNGFEKPKVKIIEGDWNG